MTSMHIKDNENSNGLLFAGFNQDQGCFACGTNNGFIIFNCDPLKERFRRDFENGGIGIVEMLFRCNILALVGGGRNPKYPPNKVMIWDDYQNKCIAELEFRSNVHAVKLRRDRIVVVLKSKVYVYNFADLQLLHQIETCENPAGICALCPGSERTVLACPAKRSGFVHLEIYDSNTSKEIAAHNNPLTQVCLNSDGTLLATTGERGTLIRIFNTNTGDQVRELRRGADRADIYSLCFHPQSQWLCVSSDKGTVHIFSLGGVSNPTSSSNPAENENGQNAPKNTSSTFSFMKDILPAYFSSEWSFAQFALADPQRCICCFGQDPHSVIALCSSGECFKYIFDPVKGGNARQEGYFVFLDAERKSEL